MEIDDLYMQVGFGLYPVIVKQFATEQKTNPVILSFYRQVLIDCTLMASETGSPVLYLVLDSVQVILVLLYSQPPFSVSG